jgi:dTDP-N-acetylfucosamine:lipid II N-acetylfucosaminyltransferase
MIFHLLTDNPVYIDTFIEKSNSISNVENCYVIIKKGKIKNIKYSDIHQTDLKGAVKVFKREKINKIIIHYLNLPAIDFLNSIESKGVKIYWVFWGGDGYRHPELKKNLYLSRTTSVLKRINPRGGVKKILDNYRTYAFKYKLEKALKRIDYCCTQIKGDYQLIMNAIPNLTMQHKYFAYRGVEYVQIKPKVYNPPRAKLSLLVGNSANPTNNHLDILALLKNYDSHIDSITCPLSYSGSKEYINEVVDFGKKMFGVKFKPLIKFLEFDKYQQVMENINVAVFYHTRQQAYSNTLMMLEQNKKILMNPESTLYHMYKEFGVKNVYSDLDDLFNSEYQDNDQLYLSLGEKIIDEWYKDVLNN